MVYWGHIGIGGNRGNYYIVYLGYIGIMDKKMETCFEILYCSFLSSPHVACVAGILIIFGLWH